MDRNWGQIDSYDACVGHVVPAGGVSRRRPRADAAEKRWIYLGKENGGLMSSRPSCHDTSLGSRGLYHSSRFQSTQAICIGHIGQFDSLYGEQVPARMVHLEMFCDDSIQSFIETSRA
ncbi:hypothetical protein ACU4GD_11780 [Cupriavidus basilensis]